MHTNAIPGRVKVDLDQVEARLTARLDRLEAKVDLILQAAGLAATPLALDGPVDVEVVEPGGGKPPGGES